MSKDKVVNPFHTSCGDCIFATKDQQTQTGCSFDRIDLHRKLGTEIIEAYDEHENEFFVINNRVCLHKRTKEWAGDYPKKKWKAMVEEQIKMKYHVMVIFKEGDEFESLKKTLLSFNNQNVPPCLLTIINRTKLTATDLVKDIESLSIDNLDWRLQTFLHDDLDERGAIDIVIDSTKKIVSPIFYIVFIAPFEASSEFSDEIQDYFVDQMEYAIFAHPREDGNGMLVNHNYHINHAGNCFGIPIEAKLKEFEEGAESYFRNIEEICPSLKM